MDINDTLRKFNILANYNPKEALNEWGEKRSEGWLNIGFVPNGSPFMDGGDAYLMVNQHAPEDDDLGNFRYRHTTYNTKPDGTGKPIADVPVYKKEKLVIYPEYRNTYYGDLFLGKRKGKEGEIMHNEFMSKLNVVQGGVMLKHDSTARITDGVVKYGEAKNTYSGNDNVGIYFWGSKKTGRDSSNGQKYTYYCLVPLKSIYDFSTNLERYAGIDQALNDYPYVAQYWRDDPNAIVVNSYKPTKITAVRDNSTGKVYNSDWQEINMQVEGKQHKNFLNEYRPGTNNNANLVSINEVNAKTLLQRHGESGFIVISPCRGFADFNLNPNDKQSVQKLAEINNKRVKQMIEQIKQSGYSYTPVYGGFIENIGTDNEQNVYERSFVIYNNKKGGENGDVRNLLEFGKQLAKEYNQDSFLFKAPNEKPKYITKDGDVDMEFSGNTSFNDFSQEYFTDLHKNTDKYSNEPNRKPTRFSYVESYINPAPQCYSERHVRSLNGEIFLNK